ncbi:hypothetical protein [Luteolibacter pohnpeiensis]|uniref:hypothetical protein n=1 Tax=Luteolibacter pohnpeiensis TaxID=454153 RepID=UPI001F4349C9|nr:hypothetical protein [Luteolibacter pohnpeiensis]
MAGLFEAGGNGGGFCEFGEPLEETRDAFRGVVEAFGERFFVADEVAEEVGLSDVDSEKEAWRG